LPLSNEYLFTRYCSWFFGGFIGIKVLFDVGLIMNSYKVLALIGDGIAKEIVPESIKVLRAVEEVLDFNLDIIGPFEFGAKYYADHDMKEGWDPEITRELLNEVDCWFKGPVGLPEYLGKLARAHLFYYTRAPILSIHKCTHIVKTT
jgi:hypothetical protein